MRQQVIYSALIMAVAPVAAINAAQYQMTTPTVVAAGATFTFDTGSKLIGNVTSQYTFKVTVGNDGASFKVQGKAGQYNDPRNITDGAKTDVKADTYTFQLKGPNSGIPGDDNWWGVMQNHGLNDYNISIIITNTGNAPLNITKIELVSDADLLNETVNKVKEQFNTYQTVNIKDYTTVSAENNARLQLLIDICNKKTEEWTIENFSRFSMYAGAKGLTDEFNSVKAEIEAAEAAKYLEASGYTTMTDKEKEALSDNTKAAIEAAKNADADHKVAATQYAAFLVKCDKVQAQIDRYTKLLDDYDASVGTEVKEDGTGGALLGTAEAGVFRTHEKRLAGFVATLAKFRELGTYDINTQTTFTEPTDVNVSSKHNSYKNIDELLGSSDDAVPEARTKTGILESIGFAEYCSNLYQEKFLLVFNKITELLNIAVDGKDAIDAKIAELNAIDQEFQVTDAYAKVIEEYKQKLTEGNNNVLNDILTDWVAVKKAGAPISYQSGHGPSTGLRKGFGIPALDEPDAAAWEKNPSADQYVPWQNKLHEVYVNNKDGYKQVDLMVFALQSAYDEWILERSKIKDMENTLDDIKDGIEQLPDDAKAKTIFNDRIDQLAQTLGNMKTSVDATNEAPATGGAYFDQVHSLSWKKIKDIFTDLADGDILRVVNSTTGDIVKEIVCNNPDSEEEFSFYLLKGNYNFFIIDASETADGSEKKDITLGIKGSYYKAEEGHVAPVPVNISNANQFLGNYNVALGNLQQLAADILVSVAEYNAYKDVQAQVYKMDGETPADGTLLKRYEAAKDALDALTADLKTVRDDDAATKVYQDSEFLHDIANKIEGYIRAVKKDIETAYGLGTQKEGERKWNDGTDPNGDGKGNATQWSLNDDGKVKKVWQADNMKARVEISAPSVKTPNSVTSKWGIAVRFGEEEQGNQIYMPKGTYTFTFGLKKDIADRAMSLQIHNGMKVGSSDDSYPSGTQIAAVSSTDAANWKVVDGEDGMKLVTATITLTDAIDKGGIIIAEAAPHGKDNGFTISNLTYTVDAHDLWQAKELTPIDKQGNAIQGLTAEKWTNVTTLLEQLESTTGEAQEAIKHYKDARAAYASDLKAIQDVLDAVKDHGVYTDTDKASKRTNAGIYAGEKGYIAKLNALLKQRTDAFTKLETPGANIDYSVSEQGENYDEIHWKGIKHNLKTVRMFVTENLDPNDVVDAADATHKLIEEWFTPAKIDQDKAAYDFAVEEEGVYALAKQIYGDTGNDNNLHTDGLAYEVLTKWTADKALTYDALTAGVDPAKVFGKKAADVKKAWTDAKTTIVNTATTKGNTTGVRKVWLADYKGNMPYANLTEQKAALSTARDLLLDLKDQLDAFNYATYKEDGQDYTNGELADTKVNDITFSEKTNLELLKKYTVDIANAFSDNQALYDSLTVDVPSGQRGAFLVVIDEAKAAMDKVTTKNFPGLDDADITIIKDYYQDVIDELSVGGGTTLRDEVEDGYTNETLRADFHEDQGIQQEFAFLKERLYLIGKYCQLRSDANLAQNAISQVAIPTIEMNPEKYGKWVQNSGKGPDVFVQNLFTMGGDTWKDESNDHKDKLTQRFVGWEIINGAGYLDDDTNNDIDFYDIVSGSTDFSNYCIADTKYGEHLNEYDAEGKVKETAFRTDADKYLERFAELISVLGTSATTINDPNKLGIVNVSDISAPEKFLVEVKNDQNVVEKTVVPHDLIARQMQAAELNKRYYDELNDINERLKTRVNTILGYLDNPSMHQATDEGTALKDIINTYYKPVYATMQKRIQDLYDAGNAYWESSAQTRKPNLETKKNKTATGDWYFTEAEDNTKSLKLDKTAQAQTFSPDDQLAYYVIKDSLDNLNTLYNTFSKNYGQYLVQKNNDIFSNEVQSAYEKAFATQKQAVLDLEEFKAPKDPDLLKAFNEAFKRATETIYAAPDALRKALALAKQSKLNADENNATYDPLNAWIKLDGEGKNTTYTDKGTTANIDPFEGNEYIDGVYDGTKTDASYIEAIETMITDEFNKFVDDMKNALADRTNKVLATETNINGRVATAWDNIKGYFAKDVFPTYERFSDVYPVDGSEDDWFHDAKKAATDLNALNTTIQDPAWKTYTQFKEADAIIISDVVTNFDKYMTDRLNDAAELDLTNRVEIAFKQYVMPNAQKIEGAVITRTVTIDGQEKTYTYGEPEKDGEGNVVNFDEPYNTQYLGFGEPADNRKNFWSFKRALKLVNEGKEGDAYAILVKEHDDLVAATVGAAALKLRDLIKAGTVYTNRTEVMNLYKQYKDDPALFINIYNKFINGFTDAATSIEYYGYSKFLENTDYGYAIEDLGKRIDDEIAGISSLYVGTEPARQAELADIKKKFEEEDAEPYTHNIYVLTKQLNDQIVDAKADDYTAMLDELTKLKNEYNLMIANAASQEDKDALTDKFANPAEPTLNIEMNIERIKELQKAITTTPTDLSDDGKYKDYVDVESNVSKIKAAINNKTDQQLDDICTDLLNKVKDLLNTPSGYLTGAKVLYPENPAFDGDFKYTDFGLHKNYLDVAYQQFKKELDMVIAAIGKIKTTIEAHQTAKDILLFQENIEKQIAEYEYGKKGKADLAELDFKHNGNVADDGKTSDWEENQAMIAYAENQQTQYQRLQKEIDDVKALVEPAEQLINQQEAKYKDLEGKEQTLVADMTEVNEKIAKMQQRLNALYLQRDNALTDKATLATVKGPKSYNIGMFSTHPELVTDEWLEKWGIADKYNKDLGIAQWKEKVDGLAKVQKQIEDMVEYAIDLRAQNKYDEANAAYTEAGTKLNSTKMRADQKDDLLVKFRGADVTEANEGDADNSFQKRLWVFSQNKDDRTKETIDQYAADIDKFIKDLLGVENDEGQLEGGFVQEIDDTKAGDSNGDGNVNALDLAYLLLRVNNPTYINSVDGADDYARCDLNNDGYIDVVDLGIMTDILAGGEAAKYLYDDKEGVLKARAAKAAGEHLVATVAAQQGNSHRIAISLQNVREYTAFQMDITLPEGMRLAGQSLSDRANGQELYANEWDGKVRIVAFTAEKSAFTANDGDLLYLDVETTGDYKGDNVRFDNVLFLTTDSKGQRFQMEGAVATGIMDRMADAVDGAKEKIYNLGGRLMDGLKKGVNIIRGDKKVIKK